MDWVVDWLTGCVPADTVLRDVRRDMQLHGTVFHLTPADEERFRAAGASADLLDAMHPASCEKR